MKSIHGEQHPLWAEQLALEDEMRAKGIENYRKNVEKAVAKNRESRTLPGQRLLLEAHDAVVDGVREFFALCESGRAGPKHTAYKALGPLRDDTDLIAHAALRKVVDALSVQENLTTAAIAVACLLEDEMHFRAFKEALPTAHSATLNRLRTKTNERYKRTSARMTASKLGVARMEWNDRDRLLIGTKLIEIVIAKTGLAQLVLRQTAANASKYVIAATPQTLEWMNNEHARVEWLTPAYMPCVIPPKPWSGPFEGGYWTGSTRRLTLVKTPNRDYLESLKLAHMPGVYGALNALQDTPWHINERVLGVMKEMWDTRVSLGVIPEVDPADGPNRPAWLTETITKEEMNEAQRQEFAAWKSECVRVHDENARMEAQRVSFSRMLSVAEKFSQYEEFFYPYQIDFRGRAYPVGLFLQPQGDDTQRGLLEFANTVPINDAVGALWLAVHGAGLWGVDKVSLEAREAWVYENEEKIIAAARDPLQHTFWVHADKPWQALAFCFDWAGFREEGFEYHSSLPIQMDGTCNGLQNFSAILRDPVGGAAVNLVPADRPQDIYQRVADLVSLRVTADLTNETRLKTSRKDEDGNEVLGPTISSLAQGWHGKITRKVCKRPVMTLAYGARAFGFRTQVFEDTIAPWKKESPDTFPFDGNGWFAASYLGGIIWDCVGDVVVAARQAMDWLQEAARVAAREALPVRWITPDGFPVYQAYRVINSKQIELTFEKVVIKPRVSMDEQKLDPRKQASSISPNWVHSLDATHMRLTINACHEAGMRSFSMIHDSYGTHAGNASILAAHLREQFIEMYSQHDVLEELAMDLQSVLSPSAELPPLPAHGDLDLSQVRESAFFFA